MQSFLLKGQFDFSRSKMAQKLVDKVMYTLHLGQSLRRQLWLKKLQSQKLAKVYMSMWARLGRFLEIYGPKFWDFD
jgi:hypothetical protein